MADFRAHIGASAANLNSPIAVSEALSARLSAKDRAGPDEYSPEQAAEALSAILGKKVTAQHAPLSAVVPTFKSFGFSGEAAQLFEEMYAGFSRNTIVYEQPSSLVRGRVTLADALRAMV